MTSLSEKSGLTVPEKHLVFISYYFPPMGGGGVQRITKFLKYFDYRKYRVSVLTVKDSFYYTFDPSLLLEIPDSVRVYRSESLDPFRLYYLINKILRSLSGKHSRTNSRESSGSMRKLAQFLFVPDSRILWLPFALVKLWQIHRARPVDAIIASMPPFTVGLIGAMFKRWMGPRLILDFRDAWTNNPYLPRAGEKISNLSRKMERFCLNTADGLIFVNPQLRDYYLRRRPSLKKLPHVAIRNGYDRSDFPGSKAPTKTAGKNSPLLMGVLGTIYSQGNRPLTLIRSLEELKREHPDLAQKFKLVFLGKWAPDFLQAIQRMNVADCMEFWAYRPHREALRLAQQFHALALAIESDQAGAEFVTPGRIYEYLYLKKPILAMCPENGDLAELVTRSRAGEVVSYSDTASLKRILRNWIYEDPDFASRYAFKNIRRYSRKAQTERLLEFLEGFFHSEK